MNTRRRFASALLAAATATSLATAPAMAQTEGELADSYRATDHNVFLSSFPVFAAWNGAMSDDDETAASTATTLSVAAYNIVPIAITIAIGVGAYNYAQSQGWID